MKNNIKEIIKDNPIPFSAVQSHQVRDILSPTPSTESPESEVARRLGVIGDQVQEEYGEAIEFAINGVMSLPREQISYDVFVAALVRAGLNSTQIGGWKQVRRGSIQT